MSTTFDANAPSELLEMKDQEVRVLKVLSVDKGTLDIAPTYAGAPPIKTVDVRRLHVPREDKPTGPAYWDVTSATLVHQIDELERAYGPAPYVLKLTKVGVAPKARYMVERVTQPAAIAGVA
jgi:hypothetical protein